jgi:3-methylcrotonyl-CoA carboxylase alpha subunit
MTGTLTVPIFDTVLIANRGEIACRIIATCRRLGIRTVAVYSDADATSRHVRLADTAMCIGPPPARESYLVIDRILEAARQTSAQAIHPGYGFLSENDVFADACTAAGIVFIGPPGAAIRAMGSKSAAKILVRQAGVPLTPGYDGSNQSSNFLAQQAAAIGYPVMIKANAGGGGKGMRRVDSSDQFASALASCQREAAASFGDDSVLIEKCILAPRHIEVQVFGDTHGNLVSLFERDCSVQRRHQKVIEEAPAPLISSELRTTLGKAARDAARAVGYVNAGTVEFLVDRDSTFSFMEMNTRLQVEHPVTEMITGLDLVEWQLRIAAGEPIPLTQDQLALCGHAIEARIYAEDPAHDFLPSIGKLIHLKTPAPSLHIRIDTGVEQGDTITPFYDPMIAKLIVWDVTRALAVHRMERALGAYQIVGVANNTTFLRRLVTSPSFTSANLDTNLIEREQAWLTTPSDAPNESLLLFATLSILLREQSDAEPASSPWARRDGWRLNAVLRRTFRFASAGREHDVMVEYAATHFRISIDHTTYSATGQIDKEGNLRAIIDSQPQHATVVIEGLRYHVFANDQHTTFTLNDPLANSELSHAREGSLLAPMPGRVVARLVELGAPVDKGAPLMVLEAMKMECTVYAPAAGSVQTFHFAAGDQVTEGVELLTFDADKAN